MGVFLSKGSELLVTPERHASVQQIGRVYTKKGRTVTDKKVSRKHATLKIVGDQLSIKPVHVNPCFYWPVEDDQLFPLDRDKWHQLCPEDLRDQIPTTLRSTMMSHSQPSEQSTIPSNKKQLPEVHSLMENATEIPEKFTLPKKEESRPAQRKRQLPEWMLPTDLMASTQSTSKTGNNEEIKPDLRKKQKILESEDSTLLKEEVFTKDVAKKMPKIESKRISQKAESSVEQFNSQLDNEELALKSDGQASQPTQMHTTNTKENKLESINSETMQVYNQGDIQETTLNLAIGIDTSNITESQEMQQSSHINKPQRITCQYGRSCYRKNPIHFQQFSHPGDSDYHDSEAVTHVDDDRPECPYGTDCYRKNPQHKLEYKHTAPPVTSVLADESDDDGEPNEYDLNDSFIDDEEEEEYDPTDEDSDWEPDCQDNDGEDTDMLLKEAQNFVKTKN
ncbi:aprataxin and PNK-like factor isoform X2 [Crotalus tigris]|uniref:aprataxin and PNK-like factor isoform X2 n=1 Tax=Crotalus tigris TaxID=88082 RepID=UPI00192F25D0|nr:aprataxin and PNK-like factor isoform X2 [Crotalus tigris]